VLCSSTEAGDVVARFCDANEICLYNVQNHSYTLSTRDLSIIDRVTYSSNVSCAYLLRLCARVLFGGFLRIRVEFVGAACYFPYDEI
jgi:hypothetical protein